MQEDLDKYLTHYNAERPHQGRNMNGKTPYDIFKSGIKKTTTKEAQNEEQIAI